MQAVILAGGFGTRISEETHLRPKPMIEIGGKPILWHIMKIYSSYGICDFIICLGYKGYMIKEYFSNYFLHQSDVTFDMCSNTTTIHNNTCEPWKVTLVDTGDSSMTGGRLRRVAPYLDGGDFCFTYGDGVSDVPIDRVVEHHRARGVLATMTAVQPPGRFGALDLDDNKNVVSFAEKPKGDQAWINGGFFVLSPKVIELISGDATTWEKEPLETLAARGQLSAYQHDGFWQCMDTARDKARLESIWESGKAPWKKW